MGFVPGAGYGQFFSYDVAGIRGDGFEVQNMSPQILRHAFGQLVFARGMNQSRDAFGKGKGGTFTVPIFQDWGAPTSVTPLTTGTAIGIGTQHTDSVSMSIFEYGTGVGYEGMGDWITNLDVRNELVQTLGNHIARMINWLDYDTLVNTTFSIEKVAAGSYSNLLGTNRKVFATAYGELGIGGVALAYDSLRKSIVPPITQRGKYLWIANAETLRNLKQGSVFQNFDLYSDLSGFIYQTLGEFMGFVFVETEELLNKGTSIVLGANAAGYGFGKMPTTYYYPDFGSDAGRLSVWKTIFYRGQGPIWRDKGTAAIVVRTCTSAYGYGSLG
jgi:hypothetical protein